MSIPSAIRRRSALSLVEVLLSLAVLITAIVAVMGGLFTLHHWQQTEHEEAVAQRVVQALAERVMGASWTQLGAADQPWSWHRREVPRLARANGSPLNHYGALDWRTMPLPISEPVAATGNSPRYPPLTLEAQQEQNDLVRLGMLDRGTAGTLRDLRVYLEYYSVDAMETTGADLILRGGQGLGPSHGGQIQWRVAYPPRTMTVAEQSIDRGLPEDADPTSADHFNPSQDPLTGLRNDQPLLVRVLATWTSSAGGPRRHELVFARRQ